MKRFVFAALLLAASAISASAEITAKAGGKPVYIQQVYWLAGCASVVEKVDRVYVTSGGEKVTMFVTNQDVPLMPQHVANCGGHNVRGANIMLRANRGTQGPVEVGFTVKYVTTQGPQQSEHFTRILVVP